MNERQKIERSHQVQAKGLQKRGGESSDQVHQAAEAGLSGGGGAMPFAERIQESFGGFDVSGIRAHTGGAAQKANEKMGSMAYATGNNVAFRGAPDLFTAAHEAAHVIQQQAGVQLRGGVGEVGDRYERHADEVAARVVQGKSAEDLLTQFTGRGAAPIQHRKGGAQKAQGLQRKGVQKRPVQFNPNRRRSAPPTPPPSSGTLNMGGLDIRRFNPSQVDRLISNMQASAARRRGYGGPRDYPASISGSGVAARVRAFLSNVRNLRRGTWDSGWGDDNGESRTFNAWDYQMRVRLTSVTYTNPVASGRTGSHGSAAGGNTSGNSSDSESWSNTAGVGMEAGGESGFQTGPESNQASGSGSASVSANASQTDTVGSGSQEGSQGDESYSRSPEAFTAYNADLQANYEIHFRPGSTVGLENIHTSAQNFEGSGPIGTVTFDYTNL